MNNREESNVVVRKLTIVLNECQKNFKMECKKREC